MSELRSVFILCKRVLVVSCWEWILSYKSYKYSLFRNLVRMAPRGNIAQHICHVECWVWAESGWLTASPSWVCSVAGGVPS